MKLKGLAVLSFLDNQQFLVVASGVRGYLSRTFCPWAPPYLAYGVIQIDVLVKVR